VDFGLAFWTATVGGAQAIGLENDLGSFGVGMQFDVCAIGRGTTDTFDGFESLATDFERYVNLGDDRNVAAVWVAGKKVLPKAEKKKAQVGYMRRSLQLLSVHCVSESLLFILKAQEFDLMVELGKMAPSSVGRAK